jgi:hypothetical protein
MKRRNAHEPMMIDQHREHAYLVFSPDLTKGSTSLNDAEGFGDAPCPSNDWRGLFGILFVTHPHQGSLGAIMTQAGLLT